MFNGVAQALSPQDAWLVWAGGELPPLPSTAPPSQTCGHRQSWVHTGHLFSILYLWGNMEEGTLQRLCPARTASPGLPGFALPAACLGAQFHSFEREVNGVG